VATPADPAPITFRDATAEDLDTLVDLHVRLWAKTYPDYSPMPTDRIRRVQWERAFQARAAGDPEAWFCAVIAEENGRAIGFSKGIVADHAEFDAELSKIYLEWSHHGRGIGRRLMGETVARMLEEGFGSMILFADPGNRHIGFYERMGGEVLEGEGGGISVLFGWRDLRGLRDLCLAGDHPSEQ